MNSNITCKPKVSVIIASYNAEKYIGECISSVINQSLKEIEIICVDDGSTDNTLQLLTEYAVKDPRIIVLHQENSFAGAARNLGIKYARGEYLSILDADDFFDGKMLSTAYNKAVSEDLDVAVFRSDKYYEDTNRFGPLEYSINDDLLPQKHPFSAADIEKDVFNLFIGWAWDKLFKTSFILENKLFFQEGLRTSNDAKFVFTSIIKANKIDIIESEPLVHYRSSEQSLSVTREKSWNCFYYALCAIRTQLQEWHLFDRFERDFINYSLHFSLWNLKTLKQPTFGLLYDHLKNEWFEDLGILNKSLSYFYNEHEYFLLLEIICFDRECFSYINNEELDKISLPNKMKYYLIRFSDLVCRKINKGKFRIKEYGFCATIRYYIKTILKIVFLLQ